MVLINGEFELNSLQFGSRRSGYFLKPGGFSVGAITFVDQDQDNPNSDGRTFGRDFLSGSTYAFEMWVEGTEDEAGWRDVSRRLSEFRKHWHGSPSRKTPRAVDTLKMWHGEKEGIVYGRPRNYAEDRTIIRRGAAGITCDFAAVDDRIYDSSQQTHTMTLAAASGGGFVAPFDMPLIGQGQGNRAGFFDVNGDADTAAMIFFFGPVTNPRLTITDHWTVGLNATIAYDQYIVIDSRSWARTIVASGNLVTTSAEGVLTRDSVSLDKMVLSPGTHEAIFTGIDVTNTASVTIAWRNSRYSV